MDGLVFAKQREVLRQFGVVLGDLGQVGVVHLAQFRRIHHHVEMADLAPGARKVLICVLERLHEIGPRRRRSVAQKLGGQRPISRQQFVHGGSDMFGFDLRKTRQSGKIKQRIH